MKRIYYSVMALLFISIAAYGQRTFDDIQGSWAGKMKTTSGELQMVLHFSMTEADTIQATADSPDQGVKGIPCGRVTLLNDTLFVDIPIVGSIWIWRIDHMNNLKLGFDSERS